MRGKYLILGIVIFILLGSSSTTYTIPSKTGGIEHSISGNQFYNGEKLTFTPPENASTLDIKGILAEPVSYKNADVITKKIHFDASKCRIYKKDIRYVYLDLEGMEPAGSPGEPMLPMKTFTIELPRNAKVINVGMEDVHYREIKNKLRIVPIPQPVLWSQYGDKKIEQLLPNVEIYSSNKFFPGKVISYYVGKNNEKKLVMVRVYPVQYIPKNGRAILITDGVIKVFYENKTENFSPHEFKNIVITPPSLFSQAKMLKAFHDRQGMPTKVVNTTWIYANYQEADDPPYEGYKNSSLYRKGIKNYNYSLAKRIIAFLNDTEYHANLKYVTFLGNARLVPPSYYYYGEIDWVPTDFFYASPDYDLVPNYFIGRIPVNDEEEAGHVINKIMRWNATSDLFRNITLSGGRSFGTSFFVGEMITIDAVNRGFFDGANIIKYFETESSFDTRNMTRAFKGDTGIIYNIAHGNGRVLGLEDGYLNPEDIMALPQSDKTPIVLSIACSNGAYDTHLVSKGFRLSKISFGESILLSDAGGIAYIGGSRTNAGYPIFTLDKGRVKIIKEPHMAGMLTYVVKAYHDGGDTLGNLTGNAMITYLKNNDLSNLMDRFTFFAFVLLGDPALKIPDRPSGAIYQKPESVAENPLDYVPYEINGSIPISALGESMNVSSYTDCPTVEIKLIDTFNKNGFIVEKINKSTKGNVSYVFSPRLASLYTIRTCTKDGKEEWLYVWAAKVVDDDFDESTPGFGITRWREIQNAIENATKDDIIYVFSGTYYENIVLDKPLMLVGENPPTTIIDGRGSDGISIMLPSCIIERFTLKNCENGVAIYADSAGIYNNIMKNNNKGIYVCASINFSQNVTNQDVQIYYNFISDNKYGIYLTSGYLSLMDVFSNDLDGNTYGIYIFKSGINIIYFNTISNSFMGLFIKKSNLNFIIFNNFLKNTWHASFCKSSGNIFIGNYWDNWIGLVLDISFPKCILGRKGKIAGLIPWVKFDISPSSTPIS